MKPATGRRSGEGDGRRGSWFMVQVGGMSTAGEIDIQMPEVDFGADPVIDMAERLVELEARGEPVVRIRFKGAPAWLVVGHETSSAVLRNDAEIPAGFYFRRELDTLGHTLLQMEGEEHRLYKALLSKPFSPANVKRLLDSVLVPTADELIDQFGDRRELDLNAEYTRRYGFNVISRLLGIPVPRDREEELIEMVGDLIQIREANTPAEIRRSRAYAAVERTNLLLRPLLEARRRHPQDDVLSYLVQAEVSGAPLADDHILDLIRSIYLAGADSTGMMLGNIMGFILSRPDLNRQLLDEPHRRAAVIDEVLRLEPVTGLLTRRAVGDTMIAGTMIPDGDLILVDVPGSNRSGQHFAARGQLALEGHNRNAALTFGLGSHLCLGMHLARAELAVSVDRLLDRLPGLRLAGELGRPAGTTFRAIHEGVPVRFDDIVPASN